uniref:Uncharacterized protein n=1 Tax=Euplotes crassus TaxID=5936 RepID=A0A7S3NLS4_EUPCR|mmetsp:Transcript_11766/g.11724  ORF Transcript_11766/g.11724 Transcript_11766/m.11724 type:complete len:669 (+) Transcript_11766:16-2022(+)
MSTRISSNKLDWQAIKRIASNDLYEQIGANRIRPSVAPSTQIDPDRAEVLGKTLGELQDFRDLAHDESLKAEQIARDGASEKRSIRDRIAEVKAKIEYKKHLLEQVKTKKKSQGIYESEVTQIEGKSAATTRQANRILKEDAQKQLDEVYRLRDKILSANSGSSTVPPQVKVRIEERMAEVEARVDRDLELHARKAGQLGAGPSFTLDETKYTLREIKKESEEIDKDIEREIDNKNAEINDNKSQLADVLKEKHDLKWKIGLLESEVNKLEFQNKIQIESQVRTLKDNKGDVIDNLKRRIDDAKYNEDHLKDLIRHAEDITIDVGFIERMDIEGDRNNRIRQLQDDLRFKTQNVEQLKDEIQGLNSRLNSIGEVHINTSDFKHEEDYTHLVKDLNIGYNDIIQSVKDHLTANAAILRKEKEIKEMEARIALIDLDALDEEYQQLRIIYDRDSEILRDLEEQYSLIHDRLIRLRARLRELNDLIRTLEDRLETAKFEIEDAERKYRLIKVPKKVEYVVNERVEDVLIKKKYLTTKETISEKRYSQEKNRRATSRITGEEFYEPTEEEFESIIPMGSKVRIVRDKEDGYYRYGSLKFFFIKGTDGLYYVDYNGTAMTFDDFITLYEAQERNRSSRQYSKNVDHYAMEEEEYDAEVGTEFGGGRSIRRDYD